MTVFNLKKLYNNLTFTCKNCGETTAYKIACNGCPDCGYDLFKVATRSGTPSAWDLDRQEEDPYLRQKRKAIDPGSGSGYKLTTPWDEDDIGSTQWGTRARGELFPSDFSETSDDYDPEKAQDVPTSYDTLLENPPLKTDLGDWFADPIDTLSVLNQHINKPKGQGSSLEGNLATSRTTSDGKPMITDDSIYSTTSKRLKGVRR
jgi:hypothetical protein